MSRDWKEFISKKYQEYKKIGYVECPVFSGEKIYFNETGFRHLIRKGRKSRERSEQIKRLTLFQYAPGIIMRGVRVATHFTNKNIRGTTVYYWTLIGKVNGISLKVVIEQIDSNPKHFLSIFDEES